MRARIGEEIWAIILGVDCRGRDKGKGEQGKRCGYGDESASWREAVEEKEGSTYLDCLIGAKVLE